jgi:hypothetical protein
MPESEVVSMIVIVPENGSVDVVEPDLVIVTPKVVELFW